MKKLFFRVLKIAVISFLLIMILTAILDDDVDLAGSIVFALDGLYITYLLVKSYVSALKKYNKGEELPGYVKIILAFAMSIMASGKSFHTHYTAVKSVNQASDELSKESKQKLPMIVYTLVMFSVITFVIFCFFLSLVTYIGFEEVFVQILLSVAFLSMVVAILLSLFNFIYNLIAASFSKKVAIFFIIFMNLCIIAIIIASFCSV